MSAKLAQIDPTTVHPENAAVDPATLRESQLIRHAHAGQMATAVGRGVAHELRNVAQLVGMLRETMKTDHDMPQAMMDAISHADATIMRQIGTLERLPPTPRHTLPVHLADVAERAAELIRRRRRGAKMSFTIDIPRTLPPAMAIENDLDEVLWELLTNARDAAEPRGQGSVHLRAEERDGELVLSVEDDGPGIPESVRPHLFAPFATTHATEGRLGIGLSMVRQLVVDNGGALEVDLDVAHGARFVVRLPIFRRGGSGAYAVLT